jgi:hypothetical protein
VQPPVVQPQNIQPPIALPYIPPAPPALLAQPPVTAPQLPVPLIIIAPPPRPFTSDGRKCHRLEAIPEEDEPVELQHPRLAELPSSSSSEDYDTPPTPQQLGQINKEAKEFVDLTISIFTQLSDVWPFHWRQQINNKGQMRYRLT